MKLSNLILIGALLGLGLAFFNVNSFHSGLQQKQQLQNTKALELTP